MSAVLLRNFNFKENSFSSGYINSTYSKTGYWFSILSVILATLIMSLINIEVSASNP